METKLSCLIKGGIGVIFGLLALVFPEITRATFLGLFWVIIGIGIILFLVLATTAKNDESLFWFGLCVVLVIIGALAVFIPAIVSLILILVIAAVAFYSGFSDITYALEHPKTKYFLVTGMFLFGALLLAGVIHFFPSTGNEIVLTVLGAFALVSGLFSIVIGLYFHPEIPEAVPEAAGIHNEGCGCHKPEEK